MKKTLQFIFMMYLSATCSSELFAQISGTVVDDAGNPLIGVSIVEEGTDIGTITDIDGSFTLNPSGYPTDINYSYVGFIQQTITYDKPFSGSVITLQEGVGLDEVIVTGTRGKARTILDSPVPVDNINVSELRGSGKPVIERMLTFKVPSFNSQNQAISDATAHYDPADLRGLGPSRTLVLINGKRKNQSAQVYLNRTPGKGEVGIDLKSIPTAAIERVEVLRDGASAQYGSDAIAGVINMVLKKDAKYSTMSARAGITEEGDGVFIGSDFNTTFSIGDGGYANLTLGYYNQGITNRAGEPGSADLPGDARQNEIDFVNENPDIGMTVGQPKMEKTDVFINVGHPIGENAELYTFHGYTTRDGKSFAYYRAPYWRRDVADSGFLGAPEDFVGYQPTFETSIDDHINSLGFKFEPFEGLNADASVTYGSNSVSYFVNNSLNRDMLKDFDYSPRSFKPGGYRLSNVIGNLDLSTALSDQVYLAFGAEYKKEFFVAKAGEASSYYKGGSDSFAGIKPEEAGEWDRESAGAYIQLDYDITDDFLLGGAARYENFSDFGDNVSYKVNGRYKIGKNGAIRASYSTGFRAPTLHQKHVTVSSYIIVASNPEPLLQGTLANDNPAVRALGVPELFAETSRNIAGGLTYKFSDKLSASVDVYQINVDDRVLFSSQIGYSDGAPGAPTNAVEDILDDNGVVAVQMFINAGDTKTQGADIVLNYNDFNGFRASLAANFNKTELDKISTPSALAEAGYDIFAREEIGLITNSRPKFKFILGLGYDLNNWNFNFNNTLFGPVTVTAPQSRYDKGEVMDQELAPKLSTDISVGYNLAERLNVYGMINNVFDVYPEETLASTGTAQAESRFIYSSEVQQLGQLGRNFVIGINYSWE